MKTSSYHTSANCNYTNLRIAGSGWTHIHFSHTIIFWSHSEFSIMSRIFTFAIKSCYIASKKMKNANNDEFIVENSKTQIKNYDEINVLIDVFDENKWIIILTNICYIFNFMINIVIACLFRKKKCFFDDKKMTLHMNDEIKKLIKHLYKKNVVKNNIFVIQIFIETSFSIFTIKSITIDD